MQLLPGTLISGMMASSECRAAEKQLLFGDAQMRQGTRLRHSLLNSVAPQATLPGQVQRVAPAITVPAVNVENASDQNACRCAVKPSSTQCELATVVSMLDWYSC